MGKLCKILFLLLIVGLSAKSQSPVNLPSPNSPTSYYNLGWVRGDSGIINAVRDTSVRSRYPGLQIMWQHAGVDTSVWFYDGNKYFTFLKNIGGLVQAGTNMTITGSGQPGDPFVFNSSGGGGSGNFNSFSFTNQNGITGTVTGATGPNVNLSLGTALNGIVNANGTGFGTVTIGTGLTYSAGVLSASTTLNGLISANGAAFTTASIGAGLSFSANTLVNTINNTNQLTNGAGFLTNITGLVNAGTNVTITGNGTSGNPYVINSAGGGGSITGAGNLSPLFTTSVSAGTINFAFQNPVAFRLFGNPTNATAAPIYFGTDATLHFSGNLLGADTSVVAGRAYTNTFYRTVSQIDDSTFTLNRADGTKDTVQIKVNFPGGISTLNNGLTLTGSNGQWGGPLVQNTTITGAGFYTAFSGGRVQVGKGASVVATNNLTLGNDGNLFPITGNTLINAITNTNWQAGSLISFIFTGTPTLKNNTIGGAGTSPMLLAGGIDYTAAPGDYIGFQYDGSFWHEIDRKLAASGGVYVFSNGLTESPATQVKLGGSLTANTIITNGAFLFTLNGAVDPANGATLNITNSFVSGRGINVSGGSGGPAIIATSSGAQAVLATSSGSGTAIQASAASGYGAQVQTVSGAAAIQAYTITTGSGITSVLPALEIGHLASVSGANGLGSSIDFHLATTVLGQTSNQIISIWTDATSATRTSQYSITGINNAVSNTLWTLDGNGNITTTAAHIDNIVTTAAGSYIILATDFTVVATGTTSTWTFPSAVKGRRLNLVNHGSGAVTLGTSVTTGNGVTTTTLAAGASYDIQNDGTVWRKIN